MAKNHDEPLSVALSFGLGRLHFVQAAEAIRRYGVDLTCIQGWVPSKRFSPKLIDRLGRLIGSPNLSVGLEKRQLHFLAPQKNKGMALPEFFAQFLFLLSRRFGLPRGRAASLGWSVFGGSSKRYIRGHGVFHVRSGAGRGGAIEFARKQGAIVVTDHSIAHPAFLEEQLRQDYLEAGVGFWMSTSDKFWASVLQDCRDADHLLVNSDFVKSTFVDRGFDPDSISVIYLGVRSDFLGLKTSYVRDNGPLKLLFTGQFGIRKGAPYLLKALECLQEDNIDFELSIFGDAAECKDLIEASPIREKICLMGFVPQEQLKSHLATSDIYVFPSLAEGCASSAMEALAAGLPVIATLETGLPVRDSKCFEAIEAKSSEQICSAITRLANDQSLREFIGKNATELMSMEFSWDDYGRRVTDMYEDVGLKQQK